ncbi:hypothetical protein [Embleya hyalina]|uniref:hypothetical protein n=1 Tax=Embleya hyalina TaxID=516124 RepID=UPI001FEBC40C|nr:hypothetical protein [Embleya hyalina]
MNGFDRADQRQLGVVLHEYAEHVLDEVALLRARTRYGDVYVELFRTLAPGMTDAGFRSIDHELPPLGARENRFTRAHEVRLAVLVRAYAEHELDQWTALRTQTTCGPVYIGILNVPAPGRTHEDHRPLDHLLPTPDVGM